MSVTESQPIRVCGPVQQTRTRAAPAPQAKRSDVNNVYAKMVIVCGAVTTPVLGYALNPQIPVMLHVLVLVTGAAGVLMFMFAWNVLFSEKSLTVRNLNAKRSAFLWGGAAVYAMAIYVLATGGFENQKSYNQYHVSQARAGR